MAYDEDLAARVRALVRGHLGDETDLAERAMFGGLAFLVDQHMAVAVSGQGGLMVRAEPAEADRLVATGSAELVEMRGRPMRGWLWIETDHLQHDDDLASWVELGIARVRQLPPKG